MRWGPSAQTDRAADLVLEEDDNPIELMLEPEDDGSGAMRKAVPGKWSPADDADQADDQSVAWTDWSLGMNFGRLDRVGRGGYSYGINVDTRDPRRVIPSGLVSSVTMPTSGFTHAPIRGFQQYGSHVYAVTGADSSTPAATSDILRIVNSDSTAVVSGRFQADTPDYFSGRSIVQYKGYLYVGGYNGFMRRKCPDIANPDNGPLDDATPGVALGAGWDSYSFQRVYLAKQNWKVAGIQDFYILANDTDATMVYTTADPTVAGNWSSPTGVIQGDALVTTALGDTRYKINSVAYSNHRIWWGKSEGMIDIDSSGYSANATPFVEDTFASDNCSVSYYHDGDVYFNTSLGLMRMGTADRIRIDLPEFVQPGFGRPVDGPVYGKVTAITSDSGWLVLSVWNGQDSFIIYGKNPQSLGIDVPVPMVWHGAFAHFPGKKITAFGKSTQTGWPMLLIGLWDTTNSLASISKQYMLSSGSAYQAWQNDDNYRFQTNWRIFFTSEDLGLPNTRKALLRGDATTENTTPARKIEIYTSMDGAVYAEETASGDPFYVLSPPISGAYDMTVFGYGTTSSLAYDATTATVQAAIDTISGIDTTNVSVSTYGNNTYRVTLVGLASTAVLTASRASLAYHLQGTALTTPRQAFIPTRQTPTGFGINVRVDGAGTATEPSMLNSLKYRLSLIEDQLEEKEYTVRIGQGVTNRHGIKSEADPVAILARLVALMSRGAIEYVNEFGRTVSGKVRSGIRYTQVEEDGGYYYRVTFRMKIQRQPFYWGAGSAWGNVSWS